MVLRDEPVGVYFMQQSGSIEGLLFLSLFGSWHLLLQKVSHVSAFFCVVQKIHSDV